MINCCNLLACRLAYLHEAIEPKVVHRDIKSSNILIDDQFNAKVSDFGLAKLLDSGESHITTRVMGTFGYTYAIIYLPLSFLLTFSEYSFHSSSQSYLLHLFFVVMWHQNMLIPAC